MKSEGLKTWLRFDTDLNDYIVSNSVTSVGTTPTVSSTNAFNNNALQLDGTGCIYVDSFMLGGQDFTVDFWAYLDSSMVENDSVFSIRNKSTGYLMCILCKTSTSNQLQLWYNSYSDMSQDNGANKVYSNSSLFGNLHHFAIVYQHKASSSVYQATFRVYIDGVQRMITGTAAVPYNRVECRIEIGGLAGGTQIMKGAIDEFRVYDGVRLWTTGFTPPTATEYQSLYDDYDTNIMVRNPPLEWRYTNAGYTSGLTTTGATQYTNQVDSISITGVAFNQPNRTPCFGIASAKEIWLRCDLYCSNYKAGSTNRWRIYDDSSDGANGITSYINTANYPDIHIWANNADVKTKTTAITNSYRYSIWLHMRSDSTNGVIEYSVYHPWYGFRFSESYRGNVHNGTAFSQLYIQNDGDVKISNIVISNAPLSVNEGWAANRNDTQINFEFTDPIVQDYDTLIQPLIPVTLDNDTDLNVCQRTSEDYDTSVTIEKTMVFDNDTNIKFPHEVHDTSNGLQNITISLSEQQLTDNITFTIADGMYTSSVDILDAIDIQAFDYQNACRIEQISKKGILASCKCTTDIDEILYQQLKYAIPEYNYEWTYEYNDAYTTYVTEHQDNQIQKMPSAKASTHIQTIATVLNKTPILRFNDYISTMSTESKSGKNYSSLISELFGWTSRLPQIMINVYIRGSNLYVIQRGYEQNTVNLDASGIKLTVHTKDKKLVRTMWGTDPNTQTEVEPLYDSWASENLTPYPDKENPESPFPSGTSVNNDTNLVEETEVIHGEERVITTYHYTDMGNGKQFLDQETTTTYVGGSKVDEVTTYHKPVSYGQAQVYSVDEDGVLGTVVSPSDFDERVTPYQYNELTSGGYTDAFVSGAHDEYGNYYPAVRNSAGDRFLVTGHTAHKKQIGTRTRLNANALLDTTFPVDGHDMLEYLTQQIEWLNRKTEETITVDLYDYSHLIDFNDKIVFHGATYYLKSNVATITEKIVNRQTLTLVRWY